MLKINLQGLQTLISWVWLKLRFVFPLIRSHDLLSSKLFNSSKLTVILSKLGEGGSEDWIVLTIILINLYLNILWYKPHVIMGYAKPKIVFSFRLFLLNICAEGNLCKPVLSRLKIKIFFAKVGTKMYSFFHFVLTYSFTCWSTTVRVKWNI